MLVRWQYRNNATAVELDKSVLGHVDIPRLRTGRVGGFFWYVVLSPAFTYPAYSLLRHSYVGPYTRHVRVTPARTQEPTFSSQHRVYGMYLSKQIYARNILITRSDTLEQIDITHRLVHKYPDTFELALTSNDVINTVRRGKISALIGIEGSVLSLPSRFLPLTTRPVQRSPARQLSRRVASIRRTGRSLRYAHPHLPQCVRRLVRAVRRPGAVAPRSQVRPFPFLYLSQTAEQGPGFM